MARDFEGESMIVLYSIQKSRYRILDSNNKRHEVQADEETLLIHKKIINIAMAAMAFLGYSIS